jgi:hypothetical protein
MSCSKPGGLQLAALRLAEPGQLRGAGGDGGHMMGVPEQVAALQVDDAGQRAAHAPHPVLAGQDGRTGLGRGHRGQDVRLGDWRV